MIISQKDGTLVENGQICIAQYKLRDRTDEQAKLFPDLLKEIDERRKKLNAPTRDQKSNKYKAELDQMCRELGLCPKEYQAEFTERILRPFSDRFWDEGCAAPAVTGYKANIKLKPGAQVPFRQPYHLSKFDQTRLSYLYEEAVAEGKVEEFALGEDPPAICTPVFIVDKKGSVIGRRVGDFTLFNKVTEDYYYPAPEADQILMRACGQQFHTTMDCVWGFSQLDVDEETSACLLYTSDAADE